MSDSPTCVRAYDLLCDEWAITGFPTDEELDETSATLGAVDEFLVDPILTAIIEKVADSQQPRLTDAEVGRLLIWCDHMASQTNSIRDRIEKIAIAVHESWHTDGLPFNAYGSVTSERSFDRAKRALTFDA